MPKPSLHPDALAAKVATLRHWRECGADRPESLGSWRITRGVDGRLHVSVQLRGPNPSEALAAFLRRQSLYLALRSDTSLDDRMPQMDLTQPGRMAVFWQLDGVWVEVWHYDTGNAPPVPVQSPAQPAPVPSRRGLGGRLTYTRNRRKKESPAA